MHAFDVYGKHLWDSFIWIYIYSINSDQLRSLADIYFDKIMLNAHS